MNAQSILSLYIVFFLLESGWETFLSILNIREVWKNRGSIPGDFAGLVDEETYRRSTAYTLDRGRFGIISSLFSGVFVLLLVLSGALGRLDTLVSSWSLHPYLEGIFYVFLVSLAFRLYSLPFSIYSQFVIEEKHGFNKMTPALFIVDLIKGLLLSAVISFILLWVLFWFMDTAGNLWWLIAFGFVALFQLLMTYLYPVLIAPLFNKFAPLEEGSLRQKIENLAAKLSFRTRGIFVMDGSKRSKHSNAYFTGLGGAKRIVLFDTLIKNLGEDETAAVLAHEIGHEKKKHLFKMLVLSFSLMLLGFFIINLLMRYEPLFTAFGFSAPSYQGILVILSFCSGPFTFFLTPLFTAFSRKHEYEADRFAADKADLGPALKNALLTLGKDNLSNFTPHPWYSFYHSSHPTLAERLRALG
jgi:STE24 endopeptidase